MARGAALLVVLLACAGGIGCPGGVGLPRGDGGAPPTPGVPGALALAGADLVVLEGSRVQLDGHASRSLAEDERLALTWSQVDGPSVVLTNPSGPSPAFVAPLSPATLRFRLRVEGEVGEAFDEVAVRVVDEVGDGPLLVQVPPDDVAAEGDEVTFTVDVVSDAEGAVVEARASCAGDPVLRVEGNRVTVHVPQQLPCAVIVDAVAADGARSAPAARVLWPIGTDLPSSTRLLAPVLAEPGAPLQVSFQGGEVGGATLAWPAGGRDDALAHALEGPSLSMEAPLRRTRLYVGGERRRGPVSGGVRYAVVDVSAGAGNRAPVARGGSDRRVRPGASFTLTTEGSFDLDGDPLTLQVVQVLGAPALPDDVQPNVFYAPAEVPEEGQVLLFHVSAFDQRVLSDPDSVRVVIDPSVGNLEPVLSLQPVRYVSPGRTFELDASGAYDPDSGFIQSWSIAQDPNDPVLLLTAPTEQPTVSLVAGSAGDVYRFRLSAFDEQGLGAYADVEVIVEEAGPYVDATLGDDEEGDGTAGAPLASLEAALEVAARHQLSELRLGAGPQLPFAGEVPAGISVVGGYVFEQGAWTPGGQPSEVSVGEGGLTLAGGDASHLEVKLEGGGEGVLLLGRSSLSDVTVSEGPSHSGALVTVAPEAVVSLARVTLLGTSPVSSPAAVLELQAASATRVTDSSLLGGADGIRTGVVCQGATFDLVRTEVVASSGGSESTGLLATGCDVQLLESYVSGGSATLSAVGMRAEETVLFIDETTHVSGAATGSSDSARGLIVEGADAPAFVGGLIEAAEEGASADTAVALEAGNPRVAVDGAALRALGTSTAVGLIVRADSVQAATMSVEATAAAGEAVAVELAAADEVALHEATLTATGSAAFGVRAAGAAGVWGTRLTSLVVTVDGSNIAAGVALGASRGGVVEDCLISVTVMTPSGSARAIGLADGVLRGGRAEVVGEGQVTGVVVAAGGALQLERFAVVARSDAGSAVGVLGNAAVEIGSSFVRADGFTSAVGVDARGPTRLRHATVMATGTAVLAATSDAELDVGNSVLIGEEGMRLASVAPAPAGASHLALVAESPWVAGDGSVAASEVEFQEAGCTSCFVVVDALVDEDTGRLLDDEAHPLVDKGSLTLTLPYDIDGEERPNGPLPDLGCDERWPEEG